MSELPGIERRSTVVIGAGHAGLAASHFLTARSIDHVVLERGEVANSWRHERWESLRLLTPNWLNRLPGQPYAGDDPDGYLSSSEVVDLIEGFAAATQAPVRTGVSVTSVRRTEDGYDVVTEQGAIRAASVVLATGACDRAAKASMCAATSAAVM